MTTVVEKTDSAAYNKGESSDASDRDVESISGPPQHNTLKRQLKNRHIAMIRCVALPTPSFTNSHLRQVLVVSLVQVFSLEQRTLWPMEVHLVSCSVTSLWAPSYTAL